MVTSRILPAEAGSHKTHVWFAPVIAVLVWLPASAFAPLTDLAALRRDSPEPWRRRLAGRSAPAVTFTDVTAPSGVTFRHAASKTRVKFLPETMGGGVAIFDADGDRRLDLFFTNGAAVNASTSTTRPPGKPTPT